MKKLAVVFAIVFCAYGFAFADAQINNAPTIDQDVFEDLLDVAYICGPTTWAEAIGFWGINGYPNLLRGPLSGRVPDTSLGMQALFIEGMDYVRFTNVTQPYNFATGVREYFADNGYDVSVIHRGRGQATWAEITAEIDAGRPVPLLVWSWNHWVLLTGYTNNPRTMTILYGHVPLKRTLSYYQLPYASQTEAIYIRPAAIVQPPPPIVDPSDEPWYNEVMQWCLDNGWELEPED
jgi:hypothetical protein